MRPCCWRRETRTLQRDRSPESGVRPDGTGRCSLRHPTDSVVVQSVYAERLSASPAIPTGNDAVTVRPWRGSVVVERLRGRSGVGRVPWNWCRVVCAECQASRTGNAVFAEVAVDSAESINPPRPQRDLAAVQGWSRSAGRRNQPAGKDVTNILATPPRSNGCPSHDSVCPKRCMCSWDFAT